MCLKKRLGVYLKKSIIVVFTFAVVCSLGICSVSASTVKTFDLYDTKFEMLSGGMPFSSSSWAWTSDQTLLLPTFEVINSKNSTDIKFVNTSISFVAGSTYSFNFWVEIFNDSSVMATYLPSSLKLKIGNKTYTSKAPSLQTSGSSRYNFTFDMVVEDYTGNLAFELEIPWNKNASAMLEWNARVSISRMVTMTITDQADKVLGGLNSTFGDDYSQPNDQPLDDYEQNEQNIINGTQGYLQNYRDYWLGTAGDFGSLTFEFFGFMNLFSCLSSIPYVGMLLNFSICLGAFGLLLGTTAIVMRRL